MKDPIKFLFPLILTFCFGSTVLYGQQSGFGIKGGINLSNQKLSAQDISITPDVMVKPHFGVFYNTMISDQFSIQNEILYSSQSTGKLDLGFGDEGLTYNYLNLPIIFKYYPTEILNLHAGPQVGILLGGDEFNGVSVTDEANKLEFGFAFGTEIYLTETLGLSARYVFGLTDIYDSDGSDHQKNRNIQFSLLVAL